MRMKYDVIVVGAGHAGCEAALAAARMGRRTAIFTLDQSKIALMPCNPSVGGPGKGHLVREIDALGGEMARNTDATSVQIRRLNTGKGPAVQSLRAQSDKHAYSQAMSATLRSEPSLDIIEGSVDDLVVTQEARGSRACGIRTDHDRLFQASAVVLTTGTFLRGRIIVGDESYPGGRAGEFPADALSHSLASAGFTLGRLKTGTPPRLERSSIDFAQTAVQEGSSRPAFLSLAARLAHENGLEFASSRDQPCARIGRPGRAAIVCRTSGAAGLAADASTVCETPSFETHSWRRQLNCFLVHTNDRTHEVIRRNLDRAPMFNGEITAAGPRYCPSIEAKIVRFADKPSHQLFLEPEGWHTDEIYIQGANTSLPAEVQLEMLQTIRALRRARLARVGYAIEYDYIPALQVFSSLETKPIQGLYLAGQIIGTTGYEDAGALGIMAGINAARASRNEDAVVLRRDQAYIGVLIDDLVTKELKEPYRMHTSQAEYRLLLREDSAEARLSALGQEVGLVDAGRADEVRRRLGLIDATLARLESIMLSPSAQINTKLQERGAKPLSVPMTAREALRRQDISPAVLAGLGCLDRLPEEVAREVETTAKYEGYIARQTAEVTRLRKMEHRRIPGSIDYVQVQGLRTESREKLASVRPRTIGQASRIGGIPPSDVALLLFHLEREQQRSSSAVV
jgi:tRNA uridine 5-carboxymethylaminomethyl modification enzyme